MIDKKEFLLQSIIKAYIEHCEPIGSSQLKSMYDIAYSPATIRGYFKKLGDEGYLAQAHASSGRTPTTEALKQYWYSKLNFKLSFVDLRTIEYLAQNIGITVFIKELKNDKLVNIINIQDKYMILEFDNFPITIKFSSALYRFLQDMIGLEINHIIKISKDVGAYELYEQISQFVKKRDLSIYNTKEFLRLALSYDFDETIINSFLNGEVIDRCEEGLYFEELLPIGYTAICHECNIKGYNSKMLIVGELSKDYEYFYNQISMS
ncbi:heat-shock protein [Malaciobacter marinus]|uniref:Heat-inducible transcription repressor n=1 Tax=Malaciobacter marinus TaxID=505249 RepID=A0A347TNZ8_9BACT|nr:MULTISPECIES: heat-shock protein [Malaciobacter]AXX88326.1 heat-inducible transcription repressor [Malaciobacter marinus]PHO13361.1 heat-shock protein [Malaciobacter marinus]PHO15657.1 heat-shock protein [Malaciobacter marinus]RYA24580.1 heat-shock protein [Malaciobacter halophilus]